MQFQTPIVRLSFPHIITPQKTDQGADRYSASLILGVVGDLSAKDKERLAKMTTAAKEALKAKFPDALDDNGKPHPKYGWPYRDGGLKDDLEGYVAGEKFFNVKSARRPGLGIARLVNGIGTVDDTSDPNVFYPGCYVRAMVNPYAYDSNGNKGVAFGLNHLVFIRDGERLDGAAGSAASAFEGESIDASELEFDEASNDTGSSATEDDLV